MAFSTYKDATVLTYVANAIIRVLEQHLHSLEGQQTEVAEKGRKVCLLRAVLAEPLSIAGNEDCDLQAEGVH